MRLKEWRIVPLSRLGRYWMAFHLACRAAKKEWDEYRTKHAESSGAGRAKGGEQQARAG